MGIRLPAPRRRAYEIPRRASSAGMRIAVLSDIHANRPALEAVLADVDRVRPDGIWAAGDLVGYYPWPNEVLEILRSRGVLAIRGNHDRAALTGDLSLFNDRAAEALRWTRVHLLPAGVGFLKGLPDRRREAVLGVDIAMYHGSPRHDDEYVYPWNAHEELLDLARAEVVLLGHTHLPMALTSGSRLLANPGSVAQPRDGDPRASWGLLDVERRSFEVRRVPYDLGAVAAEVRRAGLPEELADRLAAGV